MRKNSEIIKELESYWYDQQYLKEKLKEVEQFDKISSKATTLNFCLKQNKSKSQKSRCFFKRKNLLKEKYKTLINHTEL